jgi:hypothetical protein
MVFIVLEVTNLDGVSSITEIIHKKYTHNRSITETKFAGSPSFDAELSELWQNGDELSSFREEFQKSLPRSQSTFSMNIAENFRQFIPCCSDRG